jgi:hypothetical protein
MRIWDQSLISLRLLEVVLMTLIRAWWTSQAWGEREKDSG